MVYSHLLIVRPDGFFIVIQAISTKSIAMPAAPPATTRANGFPLSIPLLGH